MFNRNTTRAEIELWYSNLGANAKYVRFLAAHLTVVNGEKINGQITVMNLLAELVAKGSWGTIKAEAFALGFQG